MPAFPDLAHFLIFLIKPVGKLRFSIYALINLLLSFNYRHI